MWCFFKMNKQDQRQGCHEHIDEFTKHLWDLRARNKEHLNRSILTLSAALLGLSVAFIKDLRAAVDSPYFWVLRASWIGLILAIVLVLISFWFGLKALDSELVKQDPARNDDGRWTRITDWVDILATACFVLALILTVIFLSQV